MPKQQVTDLQQIVALAAKLEVDVPITRVDQLDDGTFEIWLYGAHQPAQYIPIKPRRQRDQTLPQRPPLQVLIEIPTIGAVTAQLLVDANVTSPEDLANLPDHTLTDLGVKSHTLPTIRAWLREQGYSSK